MAFGIKLVQNGVVIAPGTAVHPAPVTIDAFELEQLSFTGTTSEYTWAIVTPATDHGAVISSATSAAPSFTSSVAGASYSVTLVDDAAVTYTLDIVSATADAASNAGFSFERVYSIDSFGAIAAASLVAAQADTAQGVINTAAIQAACDAANDAGGGVVYIPPGYWPFHIEVSNTPGLTTMGGVRMLAYNNVRIEGADKYLSLLVHAGTVYDGSGGLYPTYYGGGGFFLFSGTSTGNTTNCHLTRVGLIGLYPYLSRQSVLGEDSAYRQGVYFRVDTTGAAHTGEIRNCSVTECYFQNIEAEAFYADGSSTHQQVNNHVDRNHFYQVSSNAVNFGVGASGSIDCSGDDNIIEDCGGSPAQCGGVGFTFCRNKISMPSGFYTSSDQLMFVNILRSKVNGNIIRGIHADFSAISIINIGFFFDSNTADVEVEDNIIHGCKVLNNTTGHAGIIIISASTVGATTKGISVQRNKLVECAESNHASYPGAHGIRFIGTEATTGIVADNTIDNRGVTNGLTYGVTTDVGSSVAGVVIKTNTFSSDVTTPYSLNVSPTIFPRTYTITNPSTSRALDVGAATLAELRAVVGTLIADHQAQGTVK